MSSHGEAAPTRRQLGPDDADAEVQLTRHPGHEPLADAQEGQARPLAAPGEPDRWPRRGARVPDGGPPPQGRPHEEPNTREAGWRATWCPRSAPPNAAALG